MSVHVGILFFFFYLLFIIYFFFFFWNFSAAKGHRRRVSGILFGRVGTAESLNAEEPPGRHEPQTSNEAITETSYSGVWLNNKAGPWLTLFKARDHRRGLARPVHNPRPRRLPSSY
jgi:hypothetical protein